MGPAHSGPILESFSGRVTLLLRSNAVISCPAWIERMQEATFSWLADLMASADWVIKSRE